MPHTTLEHKELLEKINRKTFSKPSINGLVDGQDDDEILGYLPKL